VPDLVLRPWNSAPGRWSTAGFTGTVIYDNTAQSHDVILTQSLAAGTTVLCSSDVHVTVGPAPTPTPTP
jgi:hypothetical protein